MMVYSQNVRVWPTLDEYDKAFKDVALTVSDPDIRRGKLSHDCLPLRLNASSGRYVAVYKISDWVVKCFITNPVTGKLIEPPPDIRERYQEINDYLREHISQLSFIVPQIWIDQGIKINGQDWPFIKSAFIQPSQTIGQFLEDRHTDQAVMTALSNQWLTLINTLESLHIAHGDLDATNILVCGNYPKVILKLVDFDSMYVPNLRGRTLYEQGHEHFQPIHPGLRAFNDEMDRFSVLVIYLSLIALADHPQLWTECKANEDAKMLLSADDYGNLRNSKSYNLLLKMYNNQNLQKCLHELERSMQEVRMPRSLSDILRSAVSPMAAASSTSYYEAPSIPIPLAIISQNPQPLVSPQHMQRPTIPDIMIPIPTEFLGQIQRSGDSSSQTSSSGTHGGQQQQFTAPLPSQPKTHPAVWWLLTFAILTLFIPLIVQNAVWLVISLVLFIITIVVWRNTSQ